MQCAFSNITYGDFQGIELIIENVLNYMV
ncbi:TPA: hypothetical protein PSJ20_000116 [Staphylococcus aureus]|nr:hypothetical protein [Staphylococcus aureus]EOR39783.1 hypothetical protein MRGR3_1658 [Staphylococcus aureus subsp. aureus MRGR3]KKJ45776.1 hypothetical protein T651_09205 [Staphylococcus aureus MRSN 2761]KKJ59147.1 hypothetical protein T647_02490 [Staphylococcus aureus MRSN 8613]KKJ60656.1 hypothetical protein T646_05225 [Staphylococcus aureus MRSN 8611]KSA16035.1 hypothetical protein ACR60_13550 [Staphylococcus aureus subsp. aureus MRSA_S4]OHS63420.1 hypothetical protein HMPREF3281_0198